MTAIHLIGTTETWLSVLVNPALAGANRDNSSIITEPDSCGALHGLINNLKLL